MEPLWTVLFFVSMFFNLRACFKLLVDWKGMLTTCRFVSAAYERLRALPDETALEADERAPPATRRAGSTSRSSPKRRRRAPRIR